VPKDEPMGTPEGQGPQRDCSRQRDG
jgi:hypothetical protein